MGFRRKNGQRDAIQKWGVGDFNLWPHCQLDSTNPFFQVWRVWSLCPQPTDSLHACWLLGSKTANTDLGWTRLWPTAHTNLPLVEQPKFLVIQVCLHYSHLFSTVFSRAEFKSRLAWEFQGPPRKSEQTTQQNYGIVSTHHLGRKVFDSKNVL